MLGTGPWHQVEYRTDDYREMRAVEGHWRHTPDFTRMIWHDIPDEDTRLANFLAGQLDTGIFNYDSRSAVIEAHYAGTLGTARFMALPRAVIHMLWHEGGHYTPDSIHHQPSPDGVAPAPIEYYYGDYWNICDDSEIIDGLATPMGPDDRRPWISCDRNVDSPQWERARKVREAMLRSIDRERLINNIAFGEGEPWYIGLWGNRERMIQTDLHRLGPGDMGYDPAYAKNF